MKTLNTITSVLYSVVLFLVTTQCKSQLEINEEYYMSVLDCYHDLELYYLKHDSVSIDCLFYRQVNRDGGYHSSLIIGIYENDTVGCYTRDSLAIKCGEEGEVWIYKDTDKYWEKYIENFDKTELHYPGRIEYIVYGDSEINDLICAISNIYFCRLENTKDHSH